MEMFMREIKFRGWNNISKEMHLPYACICWSPVVDLMQFTGLLDCNGVEIYEGDIIHWHGVNLEVKFIADGWFAETADESIVEAGQEWESSCSVIGNIHQHAHLLVAMHNDL